MLFTTLFKTNRLLILIVTGLLYCGMVTRVYAAGGIGYKGIKLNVNGTQTWYKAHNVSWNYNGCSPYEFNSAANYTTFAPTVSGSQTLRITGFAVVGWTNNADYVSGQLRYRFWRDGDTEPTSWTEINVGNYGSPTSGAADVVCTSGNDRVVGRDNLSVNLNPGVAGTYFLKIQAMGQMQYPNDGGGIFNVNDGSEQTATITISSTATDANDFFRSKVSGNWTSAASWERSPQGTYWADAAEAPGTSSGGRVSIQNGHNITLNTSVSISSLTINSGATFTGSDGSSRTLTLLNNATFTNNGTFTASGGKISFAGTGTVSGTCTFFDADLAGGVNFGSSSTISGTLSIKSGGFVSTNAVTYSSGSTLKYDNGGAYGNDQNSFEWRNASGAGYPHHVQISSNSTLNLNTTSTPATSRVCAGNLTVDVGSTVNRNNNGSLIVRGNCVVQGTLNLSTTVGGDLAIAGNADFNGTFNMNNRAVFFDGSGTQTISRSSGSMTFDYVFVQNTSSPGVVFASNAVVEDLLELSSNAKLRVDAGKTLTVGAGGTLTNNGTITLKAASESSYAQLLPSGTVSGSGTVTMEKSVTGSTAGWRFVSAPVTGGTLANFGSNVLIRSTPPNNIITLNTANPNAWVGFNSLGQSTSSAIGAGKGYALYYGGASGVNGSTVASTLSLSGSLSTSNVSVSGLSEGSVADIYGWSLVGNPFTCGISLSGLTRSNVAEAYYIWDVNKSGGAGFASYVGTTSTPSGALNGVIPPMQGFLVKATAVSPSLTIQTSARTVATPNAQLRGTSSFTHRMYLRISEPQSGKWDETALLSDPQATALFEGSFDAYKLNSWDANALNLATMSSDNQRLSINTTGDWDASLQVPLQLTTTLNGPMQLTANVSEVAAGQPLWLEDLHTGAYHDLRAGAYSFTHLSNVADRFRIHFRALSTSVKPEPLAGVLVYAYEGRLYVQGLEGACRLEVVDVRGRLVASTELESGEGSGGWLPAVAPGIYGVRCRTEQGMKVVKVRF